jgi:hypothetical protein
VRNRRRRCDTPLQRRPPVFRHPQTLAPKAHASIDPLLLAVQSYRQTAVGRHPEERPPRRRISFLPRPKQKRLRFFAAAHQSIQREALPQNITRHRTSPAGRQRLGRSVRAGNPSPQNPRAPECGTPLTPRPPITSQPKNNPPCVLEPTVYQRVIMHRHLTKTRRHRPKGGTTNARNHHSIPNNPTHHASQFSNNGIRD